MAYEPLTPAEFKTAKPQFEAVDDAIVQQYIDMASRFVDKSWTPSDYEFAWIAMTCHLMTLGGLGTDATSQLNQSGAASFSSIKSGELTLSLYRKAAGSSSYIEWLNSSPCGTFYGVLLRMNRGGARIIIGAGRCQPSGFAKDWQGPSYGWPGVFG